MKTTFKSLSALAFAGLLLVGCATTKSDSCCDSTTAKCAMTKPVWEYAVDEYKAGDISLNVKALNNSAAEGWELISAFPTKNSNGEDVVRYVSKRLKK